MTIFGKKTRSTASISTRDGVLADEEYGPLHRAEGLIEWGSITKTVTAFVATELDRVGVLGLDTPVRYVLPESALPDTVTVRSLIAHNSGLPRLPGGVTDPRDPYARFNTGIFDQEIVPTLGALVTHKPGTKTRYSNLGYAVLARVIEVSTGTSWFDTVREHLLDPYDLSSVTDTPASDQTVLAMDRHGHDRAPWNFVDTPFAAAGGLWGTLHELERYATTVFAHCPSGTPLPGWEHSGSAWWHNGYTRDAGAFVGVGDSGSIVVAVSTLGHRVGTADRIATKLGARLQKSQKE